MRLPHFSIAAAMFAVILMAVDLAALRYLYRPDPGDNSGDHLFMSLLPMSNVIAILLFRGASRGGLRGLPFAQGFLVGGAVTLLAYVGCDRCFPVTMSWLFSLPRGPFIRFCQAHLPWFVWTFPDGTSYFRYYAVLSLFYSWPQFVAAGLVGVIASRVAIGRGHGLGLDPASPSR